jgi:hypothetical protein
MTFIGRTAIISAIPEPITPLARTFYYVSRGTKARLRARLKPTPAPADTAPVFIIGCGRSGTSILGEVLAMHPRVSYIYEPYDLWTAIQPASDFLRLYSRGEHHCLLDTRFATSKARMRFQRLMSPPPGFTLIEKSPINTLRLGFLEAIAPGARFVHIVRDGVSVARSIEQMAAATRKLAFRPPLNNWWGVGGTKWAVLAQDGMAAGYYPGEVPQLTSDAQRGAYEWLLSTREVNAWRARLGERLIELRLDDLINDPKTIVKSVIDGLGLPLASEEWLDEAVMKIHPVPNDYGTEVTLPDQMLADFNEFQESYDFKGRAVEITRRATRPRRDGGGTSRRP